MPVITVLGKRFPIASDFVPFLALWGFLTHAVYFIIFAGIFISSQPAKCDPVPGWIANAYTSVLDGTLAIFGATMGVEVLLFFIGIRGTPFQESKRRWMVPALYLRLILWICQALFNAYATWVVEGPTTPECFNYHNRDVDLRVMVYMAWGFILANWLRAWIVYVLFPDYQDSTSWRRHARIMVFGCIKDKSGKDIQDQLKKQGEKPLKRTTMMLARLLKHLDLAPTDQVVGLVLLASLQRRRRGIHISAMLRPDAQPAHTTLEELQAAKGTQSTHRAHSALEGQLEHVLTRGASVKDDMAAVLGGLREGRSELLQALEADPAVAAELATKGADAAVEDGVLSETATRVLASTSSFQRSDSRNGAALQRVGSFPVASRGSSLAGALQTTALVAPCSPGGASSASGSLGGSQSTHSTFSRTFSRLAFGDSAASDGALAGMAGPSGGGATARSISGCSGGGSGGLAGGSIHRSADLSGATSAATQSNDGGKFPTVNRLRGGAGSGDDVSVQTSSPDPSTSDLTLSGIDKAAASAAADLATGSRQRAQALGEFNSGGAGHSPQPLPAAPVLGTSRAPEALQGGLNAADVERTSFGASAGGLGARRGNKERKVGFLQQLSPLRLMGLNPTRSGLAPEGDSVSGSSAAGTTATGRSEGEVRHEQMLADTLAATEPATAVQAAAAEAVDPDQQKLKPNLAAVSKLADDTQQPRQSGQAHDQEQDQGQTHGHGQHGEMGALEPTLGQLATIPVGQPGSETTTTRHLDSSGEAKAKAAAATVAVAEANMREAAEEARTAVAEAEAEAEAGAEAGIEAGSEAESGGRGGRNGAASVAKAAVNLLEAQITTALTTIAAKVTSGTHSGGGQSAAEVGHEIARSNLDTFLTPSSIAAELRPDLSPQAASDIYTGKHKQVDRETLMQARIFAKYATAVYGATFVAWLEGSNKYYTWAKLLFRRGYNAYKTNELNHERINTLSEHLNYEAIVQYGGLEDKDLLYFSYTNQALGALPYIVALDHKTKSVVVAIRGSASTADFVTDFMALPEDAGPWLPDAFKEEHPDLGPCTAHAGMLSCAAAVWEDLERHGILETLLHPPPEDSDDGSGSSGSSDEVENDSSRRSSAASVGGGLEVKSDDTSGERGNRTGTKRQGAENAADGTQAACSQRGERRGTRQSIISDAGADAEAKARGPETGGSGGKDYLKGKPDVDEHGRGPYVAAIMKRGLHKEGWKLVVTGHSLGAGVAALISLKLRPVFPKVRCWAFCPPGGLVSNNLSAAMEPWCTSVISGKDAISRFNIPNLVTMIDEMLIAIARCKQPTCKVLLNTGRKSTRAQTIDRLLFAPEEVPQEALERLQYYQARKPQLQEALLPMLPPGRAIFLRRLKAKVTRAQRRAQMRAAKKEALEEQRAERCAAKARRRAARLEGRRKRREAADARGQAHAAAYAAAHPPAAEGGHHGVRASLDRGGAALRGAASIFRHPRQFMDRHASAAVSQDLDNTAYTQSAPHKPRAANASARHARRLLRRASTDLGETAEPITPAEPAGATLPVVAGTTPDPPSGTGDRAGQVPSDSTGQLPVRQSDTTAEGAPEATPQVRDSFGTAGPLRTTFPGPLDGATAINGDSGGRGDDNIARTSGEEGVPESVQRPSAFAAAAAVRVESGGLDEAPADGGTGKGGGSGEVHREGGKKTAKREQHTSLRRSRGRTESGQLASIVEGQAALRQQLDMQASQSQSLRGRVSLEGKLAGQVQPPLPDAPSGLTALTGFTSDASTVTSADSDTDGSHAGDVHIDVASETDAETEADENSVMYERLWDAVWIHPREVIAEGILISPRMTTDHYTTSLIGALQAILSGGRETGTLEQQAGSAAATAVKPHAPIDRLQSLFKSSYREGSGHPSAGSRSKAMARRQQGSAAVDIGGSGYGPATRGHGLTGIGGLGSVGPGASLRGALSGSSVESAAQGGTARHAIVDILPG